MQKEKFDRENKWRKKGRKKERQKEKNDQIWYDYMTKKKKERKER